MEAELKSSHTRFEDNVNQTHFHSEQTSKGLFQKSLIPLWKHGGNLSVQVTWNTRLFKLCLIKKQKQLFFSVPSLTFRNCYISECTFLPWRAWERSTTCTSVGCITMPVVFSERLLNKQSNSFSWEGKHKQYLHIVI